MSPKVDIYQQLRKRLYLEIGHIRWVLSSKGWCPLKEREVGAQRGKGYADLEVDWSNVATAKGSHGWPPQWKLGRAQGAQ